MKTATIIPERLALRPSMRLAAGAHERFEDAAYAAYFAALAADRGTEI